MTAKTKTASSKLAFLKPFQAGTGDWRTASTRGQQIKQRANSHRRPVAEEPEDSLQNQLLFHTICGASNAYQLPGPQNVYWFVLEESLIDMVQSEGRLEEGKLHKTHEIVRTLILDIDFGPLVFGRLKTQLLPKAMSLLRAKVEERAPTTGYLFAIESVWRLFYGQILPTLECMLYLIESPKTISIRKAAIVAFRDHLLLGGTLEEHLRQRVANKRAMSPTIRQMVLVVQSVFECFPPSKNKLEMESLCALVVSPYLGYRGLYVDYQTTPVVKSNEPELARAARAKALLGLPTSPPPPHSLGYRGSLGPPALRKTSPSLQPVLERSTSPVRSMMMTGGGGHPGGHTHSQSSRLNYLMARIYK